MKPLFVGEVNPLSALPEHALYPYPHNCSGERLQRLVLGVSVREYLRDFDRVDLCVGRWSVPAARKAAFDLEAAGPKGRIYVLLGSKVAVAFGEPYEPFTQRGNRVILPHPSGRCRAWQERGAYEHARETLKKAGVLPAPAHHRRGRGVSQ